ncbi:MAG TPA: citramalate synthase [Deinococcales bacterium]|nr:citramalate synthase [Deinococcales bacterium]
MASLTFLDTTLRDGAIAEEVNLSVADKLHLAPLIDSLGPTYIEGGWPLVNPADEEFFRHAAEANLNAKLVAFGATRRPETRVDVDPGMQALLRCETPTVQLYGKVWPLHVERVLRTTLDENLRMLTDSISFLKAQGKEVLIIAEHFYDALEANREYALTFAREAVSAGVDILTLGDSNGRTLPPAIAAGTKMALEIAGDVPVGFHLHNDCGLALANAVAALDAGATHAQGSVNGYGARSGITDLTSLLPIVKLIMNRDIVSDEQLARLTSVARSVAEWLGLGDEIRDRPFVGQRVFAHKTETHVAAVMNNPEAYEAVPPSTVGNQRRLIIPGVGRPAYLARIAEQYGLDLREESAANRAILDELKRLEQEGYSFDDAPASLEWRLGVLSGRFAPCLDVERLRLFETLRSREAPISEAALRLAKGRDSEYVAAEGASPSEALIGVIRRALDLAGDTDRAGYVHRLKLRSLRARTLNDDPDPLRLRAAMTLSDGERDWTTVGLSRDFIQAVWQALLDGVEYGLATRPAKPA